MKKVIVVFIMTAFVSVSAWAQEGTPKVDARQKNQHARIHHGKNSDEQTRRETALLRKEQKHIRRAERRAKADGDVTGVERRKLDRKQDRASRHIRRANNNDANPN
jgi:hypothetical protein